MAGINDKRCNPLHGKAGMEVKVYLVFLPSNVAKPGEPNRSVIAAKLTREAAQSIVDNMPGAYIEKHLADKTPLNK